VSDDAGWEVAKLTISAALGGGVAVLLQHLLPRVRMTVALRADARGALRMTTEVIPRVEAARDSAGSIEKLISTKTAVTFEVLTKLPAGWIVTAPRPDLLAHAERFSETEAGAVMKYLHYWNTVVVLEERYRTSLEEFLKLTATASSDSDNSTIVLRERISRVRDNASSLVLAAKVLQAQASRFYSDGMITELTPAEEAAAERQ
jgi:hypothetical protein